jgi:3-oxoacyl-[acyl-carrier-protein] synthase-3/clorobiocin biosynthesis protein CloN2
MRPESLFIAGLGSYLPPTFSAADAVARGWYDAGSFEADGWLSAAVAGDLSPPDMALQAARSAIDRSGVDVKEIGIVLHGCNLPQGPHLWPPQTYVERHAVGRGVPCMELRQGCTALFAALELLVGYLALPGRAHAALVTLADN